jgi:glycosyltransferase involved in cell wall biosynthesis
LGVGDRVRLVGDCADMQAALKLADVALNVSTTPEGFGRTVIEAQAMGTVLVASAHGGAAETVEHGVTGFLVAPGDAAGLAEMLDYTLSLPEADRLAIGAAARLSVSTSYTTAAMQAATLAVYDTVMSDG